MLQITRWQLECKLRRTNTKSFSKPTEELQRICTGGTKTILPKDIVSNTVCNSFCSLFFFKAAICNFWGFETTTRLIHVIVVIFKMSVVPKNIFTVNFNLKLGNIFKHLSENLDTLSPAIIIFTELQIWNHQNSFSEPWHKFYTSLELYWRDEHHFPKSCYLSWCESTLTCCSVGLRFGNYEDHSIWFTYFSDSSNHPMRLRSLWMETLSSWKKPLPPGKKCFMTG